MKVIPKFLTGGYTRLNNNPVKFDNEGNLVDLITREKGTLLLPEIKVTNKDNYRLE